MNLMYQRTATIATSMWNDSATIAVYVWTAENVRRNDELRATIK